MLQLKLLALTMIWWTSTDHHGAVADPQTLLLDIGCSPCNATNLPLFFANINALFSNLRLQVSDQSKYFATAQLATGEIPVYAMFQCRNYLSNDDCLACFTAASAQISTCSPANGARVIYDGCFLRYESEGFFNQTVQTTAQGNGVLCGNQTANEINAFSAFGLQVLMDLLQIAIPRNKGSFAATKRKVPGSAIYAMAQCAETITERGCLDCLKDAFNNIQSCLPYTDGRAFDAGCFMRYSERPFFADKKQTNIDIKRFFKKGLSSKKWAIIGGGGGAALAVTAPLGIIAWRRRSKCKKCEKKPWKPEESPPKESPPEVDEGVECGGFIYVTTGPIPGDVRLTMCDENQTGRLMVCWLVSSY